MIAKKCVNYNNSILAATKFVTWAESKIHKRSVPNPDMRKRLSGASLGISIDVCLQFRSYAPTAQKREPSFY